MKSIAIPIILLLTLHSPAHAQQTKDEHAGHHPPASTAAAGEMAEGEVRRIDKGAKKITLRHGPIKSLDMPAMTMVFQVKDESALERFKVGDKVRFSAESAGGTYTVTQIEAVR